MSTHWVCPMPVFTYEGSGNESNSGGIFWIPVVSRNVIQGFYVISTGRLSVGYTTSLSGKIQALAKKTSEKKSLYLIADNIYTYAIIGDTAYYIGDPIIENEIDYLPKIVIRESDQNWNRGYIRYCTGGLLMRLQNLIKRMSCFVLRSVYKELHADRETGC